MTIVLPKIYRAAPRDPTDSVTAETISRLRARAAILAHAAWETGNAAFAAGDMLLARAWLERTLSFSPGDRTAALVLAMVQLQLGDPAAVAAFEAVTAADDLRTAWLGLAAARRLIGDHGKAAEALGRALSGHAAPADTAWQHLADEIAAASGRPGWCNLDGDGTLTWGGAAARSALTVHLDGDALAVPSASFGRMSLPHHWARSARLDIAADGDPLIGSPLRLAGMRRCDGFVACRDGGLEGWAWYPADPDTDPLLLIGTAAKPDGVRVVIPETVMSVTGHAPLARPRSFRVEPAELARFHGLVHLRGPDGRDLLGSPLDPAAEPRAAAALSEDVARHTIAAPPPAAVGRTASVAIRFFAPVNADLAVPPRHAPARRARAVTVVVPVFRGVKTTLACLEQVLATVPIGARVVVIDDASPEADMAQQIRQLAKGNSRLRLLRHATNRGFPASANAGIRAAPQADIVLLNSDTLVVPGWLERLRDVAYSAADIATVTPFSNDATILSYPSIDGGNAVPDLAATRRLAALAHRANANRAIDIPTAVGFCMYIRRDSLDQVGLLREDVFAQGYGEENDFCLRARHLGWRHVAAPGVFVAHVGGQSFGAARDHLIRRNMAVLNRLHPGYDALIAAHVAADPLAPARRRLDAARWRARRPRSGGGVLLITHALGGGVQRQIEARSRELAAQGRRALVLQPILLRPGVCRLGDAAGAYPNLIFRIPEDWGELARLLAREQLEHVELHHLVGHDHQLLRLCGSLGLPYDVHIHDYAWFCPRISLIGVDRRYCGEPPVELCEICIADAGRNIEDEISAAELRRRSAADLAGARRVIAPSEDTAIRIRRHFPAISPEIVPWEPPGRFGPPSRPALREDYVVCVIGAIGVEKGYDVLLGCARDAAAAGLKLRFVVVGHTVDDQRLLQTGRVFVTGEYRAAALPSLLARQQADLAWLPSIWPETWSFVLTEAWRAGLEVAAFDIGAPAERIRRSGRGFLLPLGLPPAGLNRALLAHPRQP